MQSPVVVDALASDASLHLIVEDILDHLVDDAFPSCLLSLGIDASGDVSLGMRPLDGVHPARLLVGFTAPAEWHAIGVASRGWAFPVAQRADEDRVRSRVCVVTMVSRSGEVAHRSWIEPNDHIDLATQSAMTAAAPSGEQMDLLRRSIGLATEPPPCDPAVYWAVEWLAGLLVDPPTKWTDIVDAHPANTLLASSGEPRGPADFVAVASTFARVCDWTRLRQLAAGGRVTLPEMDATDAAWLDEGSFARYVLNRCPPLEDLRARVRAQIGPELGAQLDDTLARLDIPMRAWPDDLGDRPA